MNAEDITIGMLVSYINKNGETITAEVTSGPKNMRHGFDVVFLKGVRGFVNIKSLIQPA